MKVIVAVFLVNEAKKDIRNGGIKENKSFTIIIEFTIFWLLGRKQYYYIKFSSFIDTPLSLFCNFEGERYSQDNDFPSSSLHHLEGTMNF